MGRANSARLMRQSDFQSADSIGGDMEEPEVWFEIQYSRKGQDDWYASSWNADTLEAARTRTKEQSAHDGFDTRIVKITTTYEILEVL